MKTVVLAKLYCANYLSNGTCNGIDFKRPGMKPFRFLPEDSPCLLACGQRCRFFEAAVMPMRDMDCFKSIEEKKLFLASTNNYARKHLALGVKRRLCPDCRAVGRTTYIEAKMRCCEDCRIRRERASNRKSQAKFRAKSS